MQKSNSLVTKLYHYFTPHTSKLKQEFQHTRKLAILIGNSQYEPHGYDDLNDINANLKLVRSKLNSVFYFKDDEMIECHNKSLRCIKLHLGTILKDCQT